MQGAREHRLWLLGVSMWLVLVGVVLVLSCSTPTAVSDEGASPLSTNTTAPSSLPPPTIQPARQAVASVVEPALAETEVSMVPAADEDTAVYGYRVINSFPHDPNAFTQGLVYTDDIFYEGTGMWGQSSLRKVEPETGEVLQRISLDAAYFGEGVTVFEDRVFQLTWRSHVGFIYDKETFVQLDTFNYPTEGWGITHDGARLIMSDGTDTLYFWDPDTLDVLGQVQVYDENGFVEELNELEYIDGLVYANVWRTDHVAMIDPETGRVVAWIDLTGLLDVWVGNEDVLNGIAYDAQGDRLFVTGKRWSRLYEIELTSSTFLPVVNK